jgi:pimeloyl-ACP methyl ester carboxylesterase
MHTLRAVIDVHGQRVSATDRLYLLESLPTLIVWGERDNTIPLRHGAAAHEAIPHSRFRTLARAAHFPHLEDPQGLSEVLREFMVDTRPGVIEDGDWGAILARRSPRSRRIGSAAA